MSDLAASFQKILSALPKITRHGDYYQASCPAHKDDKASLSLQIGANNKILLHCHAGCTTESILSALNVPWSALFESQNGNGRKSALSEKIIPETVLERYAKIPAQLLAYMQNVRGWSPDVIAERKIGYDSRKQRITIPVRDVRGELANIRLYDPKPGPEEVKFLPWKKGYGERKLFPVSILTQAKEKNQIVYLVEGEPDSLCGESHGLFCITGTGGAKNWQDVWNPMFKGLHVRIVYDNDEAGRLGMEAICRHLPAFAAKVECVSWPEFMGEKEDLTDWFIKYKKTKGDLEALTWIPAEQVSAQAPFLGPITEDSIALAFAGKFAEQLKYCHHTGAWFLWDDTRWKKEETKLAFDWARRLCRELNGAGKANIAKSATASSVERFAQSDRRFAVTSEIWDRDIWLLGTPAGTVNLKTGKTEHAQQADCITKQTTVAAADSASCPLWFSFLNDATRRDTGLLRFLWQIAGLCLTGSIREHALFFIYGPGGNGKSVFLDTLTNILGDYARAAPIETFTASKLERHPTELAMLQGARMVTASETEEGRAWAESRIKRITGGEKIPARFMHQNFFEYVPEFKLVIVGNHKPVLKSVDDAARRRFNIVPFIHKPETPDKLLEEKLKKEYPAILRWMIEGCLDWQKNGLVRPDVVVKATETYFEEQDILGRWIDERCEVLQYQGQFETSDRLFKSWSEFALFNGEQPGTFTSWGTEMTKRGFEVDRKRINGVQCRIRWGISLIVQEKGRGSNSD